MTRWLEAARGFGTWDKTDKTDETPSATQKTKVLSLKSVLSGVEKAQEKNSPEIHALSKAPDVSPYGQSLGGRQRTWTGKVVSLDEWRRLSEWDKHGSTGKMWNGLTQRWEGGE